MTIWRRMIDYQTERACERANPLVAAILAVVGLILLIVKCCYHPDDNPWWHFVSYSIFGFGMIMVYTASTLYHSLNLSEKNVKRLRTFDHIMIFIFIAATYTPVCLIALQGAWGWSLFGSIRGLALFGILIKLTRLDVQRWVLTANYVMMGWLVIVGFLPLADALQPKALGWLVAGGLFYTVGAVIYFAKRPDPLPDFFGSHEVFHIFVMMGSFSHFWLMYHYVIAF